MVGSILAFLAVLSILILAHELGHFLMARHSGVLVEEFGFGLPPRLFGIKKGKTIYSINLLPFGGFVKLYGESGGDKATYSQNSFSKKSKKTRLAIIIAGVLMNFVLGILAFAIVYSISGIPRQTNTVKVVEIASGSPAQTAGIIVGDIVKKVGDEEITSNRQFIKLVEKEKGEKISLEVIREGEEKNETKKITLIPRESPPEGEGPLGVTITDIQIYFPPLFIRPFLGIYYGTKEALFWGKTVTLGFLKIFSDLFGGRLPTDVAGPVGIFAVTSEATKAGILSLINFIGILSVNLAILNIIPFPALDGGRVAFIGLEVFLGRRVIPKIENIAHTIGMLILLFALLAITAHDIQRLIIAGSIPKFIESVIK